MPKTFATVYFDGQCPVCAREIAFLRKILRRPLHFCDIHSLTDEHQPQKATLLYKLHLRTSTGQWLVGWDAMLALWSHTYLRWVLAPVFTVLRIGAIHRFVTKAYDHWAEQRYQKLYCSRCAAKAPTSPPPSKSS